MLPLRCMDETMCSSQHLMGPDCVWLQLPGGDLQLESLTAQSLSCKKGCLVKVLTKRACSHRSLPLGAKCPVRL